MQFVRLNFDTPTDVHTATVFLVETNPLKHVAVARKSMVQHAIAEMMVTILKPYTDANAPRCVLGVWLRGCCCCCCCYCDDDGGMVRVVCEAWWCIMRVLCVSFVLLSVAVISPCMLCVFLLYY